MKKKDKILLSSLGLLIFIGGLIIAYGVYANNYYSLYPYLPFKLLGIFFAYYVSDHKPVNKKDLDPTIRGFYDKKVDGFIQKNKSRFAIKCVFLIIVITDIYLTVSKQQYAEPFAFGDAFSLVILYFFMMIGLGEGINMLYASMTSKKKRK